MDDFSTPGITNHYGFSPSPANFIAPMKRPLSSACPFVLVDENNDAVFVSGSAGGSRITSTAAYVSSNSTKIKLLAFNTLICKKISHVFRHLLITFG